MHPNNNTISHLYLATCHLYSATYHPLSATFNNQQPLSSHLPSTRSPVEPMSATYNNVISHLFPPPEEFDKIDETGRTLIIRIRYGGERRRCCQNDVEDMITEEHDEEQEDKETNEDEFLEEESLLSTPVPILENARLPLEQFRVLFSLRKIPKKQRTYWSDCY
jgi:hypothetical protein